MTRSAAPAELAEWDDLVRSVPGGDVAQLSGWGRLREQVGYSPVHVFLRRGNRLAGGVQVLERRLGAVGRIGYVPYGPLVAQAEEAAPDVRAGLADALAELARRSYRLLVVQPGDGQEAIRRALLDCGFRPSTADIAPAASAHVDLSLDEEQLRHGLDRGLRRRMRLWPRNGVAVRRADRSDMPVIAQLLARSADYHDFTPYDIQYLTSMYDHLEPTGNLVTFIGEHEGTPVAMTMFTGCGGVLKSRLSGFDRSVEAAQRFGLQGAVNWTAILWARQNGYKWLDLGGLLPESAEILMAGGPEKTTTLPGPDQFKLGLGAKPYSYPSPVEFIPSRILRYGYDLIRQSSFGRHAVEMAQRAARSGSSSSASAASSASHGETDVRPQR